MTIDGDYDPLTFVIEHCTHVVDNFSTIKGIQLLIFFISCSKSTKPANIFKTFSAMKLLSKRDTMKSVTVSPYCMSTIGDFKLAPSQCFFSPHIAGF